MEILVYDYSSNQKGENNIGEITAEKVYILIQCSKSGKEFKRKLYWTVEGIARRIENNEIGVLK